MVGGAAGASPNSPKEPADRKPYDTWNDHELLSAMQDLQVCADQRESGKELPLWQLLPSQSTAGPVSGACRHAR